MKHKILVIDDDTLNLSSTKLYLESCGFETDIVNSGDKGIKRLQNPTAEYAVILLDYRMPGMSGAETALKIRALNLPSVVLMYSGDDRRETLKTSFRVGALDFIEKSEDPEVLKSAVLKACLIYDENKIARPSQDLSENEKFLNKYDLAGRSTLLTESVKNFLKFMIVDAPVLLLGETGVGKELFAKIIAKQTKKNCLTLNCGTITNSNLLESELFGHEKGAFTGADHRKIGLLEAAGNGIVFLDEIHSLTLTGQASLLRAIAEKKIRRVGGLQEIDIQSRIIAATKPEIKTWIKEGKFLPDLFYRLQMLMVEIPPLRDRLEDIEPLVFHFLKKAEEKSGLKKSIRSKSIRMLESYNWPGNIRELEGTILSAVATSTGAFIEPSDLDVKHHLSHTVERLERDSQLSLLDEKHLNEKRNHVIQILKLSRSQRQAAEKLGINESTLRRVMQNLNIDVSA